MTPEERILRDMWMREMWRPVREYHAPPEPRPRPVDKTVDKRQRRAA